MDNGKQPELTSARAGSHVAIISTTWPRAGMVEFTFEGISARLPETSLLYVSLRRVVAPKAVSPIAPSQPLAVVMTRFDFMKQFSMFATLAAASGGSAPSR